MKVLSYILGFMTFLRIMFSQGSEVHEKTCSLMFRKTSTFRYLCGNFQLDFDFNDGDHDKISISCLNNANISMFDYNTSFWWEREIDHPRIQEYSIKNCDISPFTNFSAIFDILIADSRSFTLSITASNVTLSKHNYFQRYENFTKLEITGSGNVLIEKNTLDNITSLQAMIIRNNEKVFLTKMKLDNLKYLTLIENKQLNYSNDVFQDMTSLQHLIMYSNNVESLKSENQSGPTLSQYCQNWYRVLSDKLGPNMRQNLGC